MHNIYIYVTLIVLYHIKYAEGTGRPGPERKKNHYYYYVPIEKKVEVLELKLEKKNFQILAPSFAPRDNDIPCNFNNNTLFL